MAISDKALGLTMTVSAIVIFVYYSIWVLLLPFVDERHDLYNYFPSRHYAISIPASILVFAVVTIGSFIGIVLIKESNKNKNK